MIAVIFICAARARSTPRRSADPASEYRRVRVVIPLALSADEYLHGPLEMGHVGFRHRRRDLFGLPFMDRKPTTAIHALALLSRCSSPWWGRRYHAAVARDDAHDPNSGGARHADEKPRSRTVRDARGARSGRSTAAQRSRAAGARSSKECARPRAGKSAIAPGKAAVLDGWGPRSGFTR